MGGGDGNGADDDYVHEQREGRNFLFFSVQGIPLTHLRAHANALGT